MNSEQIILQRLTVAFFGLILLAIIVPCFCLCAIAIIPFCICVCLVKMAIFSKPGFNIAFGSVLGYKVITMFKSYNDVLNSMYHEFRGGETEETWKKRQDLCLQLNDMLSRQDPDKELPKDFYENVKPNIGSIVAAAKSERTTLSGAACKLISNLIKVLGSQIHPHLDHIFPSLIDHCGSTKAVNQKNAHDLICTLVTYAGFSSRIVYHVCEAFKDKRIPVRTYAPIWLKLIIHHYDLHLDSEREYHMIEKAIASGLNDGQVKVRENSRATYWRYARLDSAGAHEIMQNLNTHAATALENDPHNPDKPKKIVKEVRSESALAQIKAQRKRIAAAAAATAPPAPVAPVVINLTNTVSAPVKTVRNAPPAVHHDETANATHEQSSRHTKAIPTQMQAPDAKSNSNKENKSLSSSTNSRPLLSAPLRRPRIVATPMTSAQNIQTAAAIARPASRSETVIVKRAVEPKERSAQQSATGRQTPVVHEDVSATLTETSNVKATKKSAPIKIPKSPRSSPPRKAPPPVEQQAASTASTEYFTAPQTQLAERYKKASHQEPQLPPPGQYSQPLQPLKQPSQVPPSRPHKRAVAASNDSTQDQQRSATVLHHPDKSVDLVHQLTTGGVVIADDKIDADQRSGSVIHHELDDDHIDERFVTNSRPPIIPSVTSTIYGKENFLTFKASHSKTDVQSSNYNKYSDHSLMDARKALAIAMEKMRRGQLDVLGYRKLRKLIESHPVELVTTRVQFEALYDLLVQSIASFDELTEPRETRAWSSDHAMYSRQTNIILCFTLLEQYPQWSETQPGQYLQALLIARSCHPDTHGMMIEAIKNGVAFFITSTRDPLACIDTVLDTIADLEAIILDNNAVNDINMRGDFSDCSSADPRSVSSDFGLSKVQFPNRLPAVIGFGLQVLNGLLMRAIELGNTPFSVQEDRLASLAEHCLVNYDSVIKRRLMHFCVTLHTIIKPEKRFFSFFSREDDVNLINYYVAGSPETMDIPYGY